MEKLLYIAMRIAAHNNAGDDDGSNRKDGSDIVTKGLSFRFWEAQWPGSSEVIQILSPVLSRVSLLSPFRRAFISMRLWGRMQRLCGYPFPVRSAEVIDPQSLSGALLLRSLQRFFLFSICAYAPSHPRMSATTLASVYGADTKMEAMLRSLFPNLEMMLTEPKTHEFIPSHMLFADHAERQVVLSIRGSAEAADWLINLRCKKGGDMSHEGMSKAADALFESIITPTLNFLRAHPGYTFHVCGHSLGGGIATLFLVAYMRLMRKLAVAGGSESTALFYKRQLDTVHAWSYGAPCVMSVTDADKYKRCVVSVVYGKDAVARFSYGSVDQVLRVLESLTASSCDSKFRHYLSPGNIFSSGSYGLDLLTARKARTQLQTRTLSLPRAFPSAPDLTSNLSSGGISRATKIELLPSRSALSISSLATSTVATDKPSEPPEIFRLSLNALWRLSRLEIKYREEEGNNRRELHRQKLRSQSNSNANSISHLRSQSFNDALETDGQDARQEASWKFQLSRLMSAASVAVFGHSDSFWGDPTSPWCGCSPTSSASPLSLSLSPSSADSDSEVDDLPKCRTAGLHKTDTHALTTTAHIPSTADTHIPTHTLTARCRSDTHHGILPGVEPVATKSLKVENRRIKCEKADGLRQVVSLAALPGPRRQREEPPNEPGSDAMMPCGASTPSTEASMTPTRERCRLPRGNDRASRRGAERGGVGRRETKDQNASGGNYNNNQSPSEKRKEAKSRERLKVLGNAYKCIVEYADLENNIDLMPAGRIISILSTKEIEESCLFASRQDFRVLGGSRVAGDGLERFLWNDCLFMDCRSHESRMAIRVPILALDAVTDHLIDRYAEAFSPAILRR